MKEDKKYYIIGAGGFAKEVYFLAQNNLESTWQFGGFIDYQPKNTSIPCRGKDELVIDENKFLDTIKPSENVRIYIGIGDGKKINQITSKFSEFDFPNLIASDFIGDIQSIQLDRGNIILSGCIFTVDIEIGSFNIFNLNTTLGHDSIIRDCNVFNPGCNISGSVNIGSNNLFGTNSTVLQNLRIGNNNILGASSLANKDFENDNIMVGIPAKPIRKS